MTVVTKDRLVIPRNDPGQSVARNVKTYGAKGDGVTDDSVAIQAALDAAKAAGGGVVLFPEGTFIVGEASDNGQIISSKIKGGLKIGSNTVVQGSGWGTIIKIADGNNTPAATWQKMPAFINDDHTGGNTNIVIRDLKIDGNRNGITGAASEQEGIDFINVDNSRIENVWLIDVRNDAIDLDTSDDCTIDRCRIEWTNAAEGWNGVHGGNSNARLRVSNCFIRNAGLLRSGSESDAAGVDWGGASSGTIVNNHFNSCHRAIFVESGGNSGVVQGNVIIEGTANIACIEIAGSYINCVGNSIYVTTAGQGININTGAQGAVIADNTIRVSNFGINSQAANHIIKGNVIRSTTVTNAIRCTGASPVVTGNTIERKPSSSARGAIEFTSTAVDAVCSGNVIGGNQAGRAILTAANNTSITGNNILQASSGNVEIELTADNVLVSSNRIDGGTNGIQGAATADKPLIIGNNCVGCTTAWNANSSTNATAANNTV